MKTIILTNSQLKNYINGSTLYMFKLTNEALDNLTNADFDIEKNDFFWENPKYTGEWLSGIKQFSPLQIGDKDIIIKNNSTSLRKKYTFKEVLNVKIIDINNISDIELIKIGYTNINKKPMSTIRQIQKEYNINLKNNNYVFLIEVKL